MRNVCPSPTLPALLLICLFLTGGIRRTRLVATLLQTHHDERQQEVPSHPSPFGLVHSGWRTVRKAPPTPVRIQCCRARQLKPRPQVYPHHDAAPVGRILCNVCREHQKQLQPHVRLHQPQSGVRKMRKRRHPRQVRPCNAVSATMEILLPTQGHPEHELPQRKGCPHGRNLWHRRQGSRRCTVFLAPQPPNRPQPVSSPTDAPPRPTRVRPVKQWPTPTDAPHGSPNNGPLVCVPSNNRCTATGYFPEHILSHHKELPRVSPRVVETIWVGLDPASHMRSSMGLAAIAIKEGVVTILGTASVKAGAANLEDCCTAVVAFVTAVVRHRETDAAKIIPVIECNASVCHSSPVREPPLPRPPLPPENPPNPSLPCPHQTHSSKPPIHQTHQSVNPFVQASPGPHRRTHQPESSVLMHRRSRTRQLIRAIQVRNHRPPVPRRSQGTVWTKDRDSL